MQEACCIAVVFIAWLACPCHTQSLLLAAAVTACSLKDTLSDTRHCHHHYTLLVRTRLQPSTDRLNELSACKPNAYLVDCLTFSTAVMCLLADTTQHSGRGQHVMQCPETYRIVCTHSDVDNVHSAVLSLLADSTATRAGTARLHAQQRYRAEGNAAAGW